MSLVYAEIYKIVQSIPRGRVLTYGLISHMIGGRMSAQGVGWALKALGSAGRTGRKEQKRVAETTRSPQGKARLRSNKTGSQNLTTYNMDTVPWQRVVNAEGGTSTHKIAELPSGLQQHLLELEGIVFDDQGKIDLEQNLWHEGIRGAIVVDRA